MGFVFYLVDYISPYGKFVVVVVEEGEC